MWFLGRRSREAKRSVREAKRALRDGKRESRRHARAVKKFAKAQVKEERRQAKRVLRQARWQLRQNKWTDAKEKWAARRERWADRLAGYQRGEVICDVCKGVPMEPKRKTIIQTHSAGRITTYATHGVGNEKTKCTIDSGHDLSNGDTVDILGSTAYDDTDLTISEVDSTHFVIETDYTSNPGTGMYLHSLDAARQQDAEQYDEAILYVDITLWVSGTLIVGLESSPDMGTSWYSVMNSESVASTGKFRFRIPAPLGKLVRPSVTLTGATVEMSFTIRLELDRTGG